MSDRSHVLELPKFMLALRAVQGGIALVVLGLSAYAVSQLAADGPDLAVFAVSPLRKPRYMESIWLTSS